MIRWERCALKGQSLIVPVLKDGIQVGTIDTVTAQLDTDDPTLPRIWQRWHEKGIVMRVWLDEDHNDVSAHVSLIDGIAQAFYELGDYGYDVEVP